MTSWLLALDFGGTKHTVGLLSTGAYGKASTTPPEWHRYRQVFSPAGADARYDLDTVLAVARELLDGAQPAAVGVSFGGPVDAGRGLVRLSHHIPGWENIPLAGLLRTEFGAPALVDNDANVAAQGEHRFGAGKGLHTIFYMTVSTGVGGGWLLDGKPWRGVDGMAGEIGHMTVDPAGPWCLCGKRGCVERFASGPYMAHDARQALRAQPQKGQILRDLVSGNLEAITGKTLSQAAAQGDDLAWSFLERGAWALGTGIGNAANLVNPQRFILGGGVTKAGERYWEVIRQVARQTALTEVHFDIMPAQLGDNAPLYGAAVLAQSALGPG